MSGQLPEPLTPSDCDLTDFGFMPLEVARLRDSKIVDEVSGDEFRAAVLLWCAAWHQVPAGSLPDDEGQLAKFAGYGRVIKEWLKVRGGALHGFVKCLDGRLYHPVICEKACESWAGKCKHNAEKAADRARKKARLPSEGGSRSSGKKERAENPSGGIPAENSLKGEGQGKGEVKEEVSEPKGSAAVAAQGELIEKPAPAQSPLETQDPKDWLFREGLRYLVDSSGKPPDKLRSLLGKWRRDMREDVEALRGLLRMARDQRIAEPVAWVTKAIVERTKGADVAFAPTDETGWRQRFDAYRETGGWPAHWGGAKPGDDPRHPPELLIKYGFNDAVMPGFLKALEPVPA